MGVIKTIVDAAAKKVLIDSAGSVVLSVAAGTAEIISKVQERAPGKRNHVCTLRNAEEFLLLSVQDAQEELAACGFRNIEFIAKKAFLRKDGQVLAITIDGRSTFTKKTRFSDDARVVIVYKGK